MKKKPVLIGGVVIIAIVLGALFLLNDMRTPAMLAGDLSLVPEGVAEVRPSEVITLKDGDTFALEATIVRQEIGNRTVKRLAYNGQIPGPLFKVEKGAKVTVHFTNNTDMETALHSHGLRGDWRSDGVAPLSQDPIKVGETFTYELSFPDTGIFWYHPHVREDYQQELGLYGNILVEEEGYWNPVAQEEFIILDDMLRDGEFSSEVVTHTLMGRYGDTLLINDSTHYNVTVAKGEIQRMYITNVANTRVFDITFKGAQMKLVGGDNGRIEKETMITHAVLAPSERQVVELLYTEAGTYSIEHRGKHIGTVTVRESSADNSASFAELHSHAPDYAGVRDEMDMYLAKAPDKRLRLDIAMKGAMGDMMGEGHTMVANESGNDDFMREHCKTMPEMQGCEKYADGTEYVDDGIEWEDGMAMMNAMSTDDTIEWIIEDEATRLTNHEIQWSFKRGDMVKVRIYNDEKSMHPMQHPIHFHGQRFVILATDGVPNENLQWKDTTLIPKGKTVDILVDMSNPGKWMAHCHIAEHLHAGMMFDFEVVE